MKYLLPLLLLAFNANAETTLEIGQGWASGDPGNAAVIIGERNDKYGISVGWIERHWVQADGKNHELGVNIFVELQRHWQYKKIEFSLGPAYFQNTNRALAKNFNMSVALKYNINEDVSIVVRHWSNAGSGAYNMGHDFIGIGFRF